MITPKTTDIATTATDCLKVDCLSGQETFLNSALSPSKNLGFAVFSAESPILTSFPHIAFKTCDTAFPKHASFPPDGADLQSGRLLGLLMRGMGSAESAVLLGFHTVRMGFLILGGIVVTLFAFCACQSDSCTHSLLHSAAGQPSIVL